MNFPNFQLLMEFLWIYLLLIPEYELSTPWVDTVCSLIHVEQMKNLCTFQRCTKWFEFYEFFHVLMQNFCSFDSQLTISFVTFHDMRFIYVQKEPSHEKCFFLWMGMEMCRHDFCCCHFVILSFFPIWNSN